LLLGRDLCGLTLRSMGEQMGGMDYASVHMAIRRLEQKMERNPVVKRHLECIKREIV
jgi:chromosomal replication initiation ATPase DnaA